MSENIRYVRVYVTEARAGDIPMGFREVLVIDGEGLYPSVFYLGTMSLCALLKEDFESAVEREVTPAMCKSMQNVLSTYKFSGTVPDRDEAVMRIQAWLRKKESAPRVRQRAPAQAPEAPAVRVRSRAVPQQAAVEEQSQPAPRTRVRAVATTEVAEQPKVRTRTRVIK